jgi:DNA-binding IclR family transcriptional regulator
VETIRKDEQGGAVGKVDSYFSKVIEKGMRILTLFTPETKGLSLTDITLRTHINMTSAFRFVETFSRLGYLKKEPGTKLIKLGPMAMAFSNNVIQSFDTLQIIKPYIDEAFDKYNVTIDSGIVEGGRFVNLYRREAKDTLVFKMPVSTPLLQCTAVGKAFLAWLPDEARDRILDGLVFTPRTRFSLTSRAAVLDDLRRTHERGYSLNNEEYVVGLICIGAPFLDSEGAVLGAVSFDFSTVQYSLKEAEKRFAAKVVDLARNIRPMLPAGIGRDES